MPCPPPLLLPEILVKASQTSDPHNNWPGKCLGLYANMQITTGKHTSSCSSSVLLSLGTTCGGGRAGSSASALLLLPVDGGARWWGSTVKDPPQDSLCEQLEVSLSRPPYRLGDMEAILARSSEINTTRYPPASLGWHTRNSMTGFRV